MSDLMFRTFDQREPLRFRIFDRAFALHASRGLFSVDRLDDGTRLLLECLPEREPQSVFDLGCGVGALGLPIAQRFEQATVTMVDRDALAVAYAKRNAERMGLHNVRAHASLGFDAVPADARFDWILSNIPARIGQNALQTFAFDGLTRMAPGGTMRWVVISDLMKQVKAAAQSLNAQTRVVENGRNHVVVDIELEGALAEQSTSPYVYSDVTFDNKTWQRFTDASESPELLREGLPLLLELLPRDMQGKRALVVHGSWGLCAVTLATRGAQVTASDRDLLALDFTRRNAQTASVSIEAHPSAWPWTDYSTPLFDCIIMIPSENLGADAARIETTLARKALLPRGFVLTLAREKFFNAATEALRDKPRLVAKRGPYAVWRDEGR